MSPLNQKEKNFLLQLALQSIKEGLEGNFAFPSPKDIPYPPLKEKGASFVTLYVDGKLHGCIGHLQAIQPLYKDVYENAFSAAFKDPRFPPLTEDDFNKLKLEISLLSPPKEVSAHTPEGKLAALQPGKHGVVLRFGDRTATFLPQVWQELPDKRQFLGHLCLKALLPANTWEHPAARLFTYTVEKFSAKAPSPA